MQKKRLRKYLSFLFVIVIFALTLWSVFDGENLRQLWRHLQAADNAYIASAVVCVVLFILSESVIIHYLLRTLGTKSRFFHCCLYSFIGFFYSCITPSASGGQPMQVVAMRKDDIPVPVSTVVLAIITIIYKLVLVLIGTVVMLIRPAGIVKCLDDMQGLIYLGLVLNVGCIIALFLLVFDPNLLRRAAGWILRLINRIRPLKHPERAEKRLEEMVGQYTGAADYFRSHQKVIAGVFLITLLQRVLLFMVTWFTYRAFHLQGESLIKIITLQAMISVAVDMLPLPGGMGASENLFLEIFLPVFGEALVLPGMVISRGVSYYTQLVISAVMTLAASVIIREKE